MNIDTMNKLEDEMLDLLVKYGIVGTQADNIVMLAIEVMQKNMIKTNILEQSMKEIIKDLFNDGFSVAQIKTVINPKFHFLITKK